LWASTDILEGHTAFIFRVEVYRFKISEPRGKYWEVGKSGDKIDHIRGTLGYRHRLQVEFAKMHTTLLFQGWIHFSQRTVFSF
jgi:hypothetical protein